MRENTEKLGNINPAGSNSGFRLEETLLVHSIRTVYSDTVYKQRLTDSQINHIDDIGMAFKKTTV